VNSYRAYSVVKNFQSRAPATTLTAVPKLPAALAVVVLVTSAVCLHADGERQDTPRVLPSTETTGLTVAAGVHSTCAVTSLGALACWGDNGSGQLGDGTTRPHSSPIDVSGLSSGVAAVVARNTHICALTGAGGVKCWGSNSYGQLGDGSTTDRSTPVNVAGLTSGVAALSVGYWHTCALTTGGGVKCWGDNSSGQLGDGTTIDRSTPVDVLGLTSGVLAVATGAEHTCVLTTAAGVSCFGYNNVGQLGDGTVTNRLTATNVSGLTGGVAGVAAGAYYTCAVTVAGSAKCWGDNYFGQLGDGSRTGRLTPGDVSGLGSGIAALDTGNHHTCALTTGGGLKCWGDNFYGQVGDGSGVDRLTPVDVAGLSSGVTSFAVGYSHTCAASGDNLNCWGDNSHGQLSDGRQFIALTVSDVVGLTGTFPAVSAGEESTCARTPSGGVKCWGDNFFGQLGDGSNNKRSTPADVSNLSGVTAVAAGGFHVCVLVSGGGVKCWGSNGGGRLGDGTTSQRTTPVDVTGLTSGVSALAAGNAHTCAVTDGGALKCWGYNAFGQVGDGTTTDRLSPVDVQSLTSGVTAGTAAEYFTCALTSGGGVLCWGDNSSGQLGDGTTTSRSTPVPVTGLTSGIAAVVAGGTHTCVLTTSGGVKCWGNNSHGQLGDGTTTDRVTPVDVSGLTSGIVAMAAGDRHTCVLTAGGGVRCWGDNGVGQLGDGSAAMFRSTPGDVALLTSGVSALAAAGAHTCAVLTAGGIKCWGNNADGQLGDGNGFSRVTPTPVHWPQAFTDASLVSGVTSIRAVHISELRARIDGARVRLGLSAYTWTDPSLTAATTLLKAVHIAELRQALAAAYTAAGRTSPIYQDPSLAAGMTVNAAHVAELRAALVTIE
jgi:alpha-tubulin suppressor-like RCC1 family protein